jgi:RNA polymerase sigma factor (sigma-70 family)
MSTGDTVAGEVPWSWRGRSRLLGDRHLARLAKRGDRKAFETIFRRYHQELYRYCRAILGDEDEAHDALQSTMAAALHSLPGTNREIALRPWLYRVAHNEAISILRRRQAIVDPVRTEHLQSPAADVETESRERLRRLVSDLRTLPERQRSALVMRELSGLGYDEIAQALDASEGTARQTVYEARVALQELAEGAEMDCELARRAVSDGDGRVLRGRRLRAHLRACARCRDFEAGINGRRIDFQLLTPPLPVLAASGVFAAIIGKAGSGGAVSGTAGGAGVAAGGAGVAGGLGAAGAAPIALKAGSVVAAIAIGGGAAGVTGAVDLPFSGNGGQPGSDARPQAHHGSAAATGSRSHPGAQPATSASDDADRGSANAAGGGQPNQGSGSNGPRNSDRTEHTSHGNAVRAHGEPAAGRGNSAEAHGQAPGTPGTPPPTAHGGGANGTAAHGEPAQAQGNGASASVAHGPPATSGVPAHSRPAPEASTKPIPPGQEREPRGQARGDDSADG